MKITYKMVKPMNVRERERECKIKAIKLK